MSTIGSNVLNSVNGSAAAQAAAAASKSDGADLQDSFMTLLVTQLKNQDPMNPMENAEMTSQLAQINTVSGISELNSTLEGITGQLDAGQAMQAAGLIGSGVLVPGNRVLVGEDGSTTPFGVELGQAADAVRITVRNDSGGVGRRFALGPGRVAVAGMICYPALVAADPPLHVSVVLHCCYDVSFD